MKVLEIQTWIDTFDSSEINLNEIQEYLNFVKSHETVESEEYYSEWHHVMPKCIDKERKFVSEGVRLLGSDHLRAHTMLIKCFNGTLKSKLSYAVSRMNKLCREGMSEVEYNECKRVANLARTREYLPQEVRDSVSRKTSERVKGSGNPMYRKRLTEEQMQRRVQSFKNTINHKKQEGTFNGAKPGFTIYNNGINELHIFDNSIVPDGFVKGRLPFSEETRKRISKAHKLENLSEETRQRMSDSQKNSRRTKEERRQDQLEYIASLSEEEFYQRYVLPRQRENLCQETRRKMSQAATSRNIGRVWVNNGSSNKFVKYEELASYEIQGYHVGRIQSNLSHKGTFFINDGQTNRLLKEWEPIPEGWRRGMIRREN